MTVARARAMLCAMNADDTPRELQASMLIGRVHSVEGKKCRVVSGGIVTDALPWFASYAGDTRSWSTPSEGEQVMVLSPSGDLSGGVVLRGLFSDTHDAPSLDPAVHLTVYPDGTRTEYNHDTHRMVVTLCDGGEAEVTAAKLMVFGDVEVDGDVTVSGDIDASGTISGAQDVVGGGISLKTHRHGGVQSGGSQTGTPT